jgi:hypothetical protein
MTNMNLWGDVVWSFFATLVLTTIMDAGRGFGFTRMDIPFILGTIFTSHRDRAKWLGFIFHLLNGWVLAIFYLALIDFTGLKYWWFGMAVGFIHGAFMLLVVSELLPPIHPRMASEEHGPDPTRLLEPPGALALN